LGIGIKTQEVGKLKKKISDYFLIKHYSYKKELKRGLLGSQWMAVNLSYYSKNKKAQ
jgi:hypothetical protein